jgi:hypothetical protein
MQERRSALGVNGRDWARRPGPAHATRLLPPDRGPRIIDQDPTFLRGFVPAVGLGATQLPSDTRRR